MTYVLQFLLLLTCFSAYGSENFQTIKFNQHAVVISTNCVKEGKILPCQAAQALKKADLSKLKKDALGRNPGARLCTEQLGGKTIWSQDAKGNERTFCQFPDDSFVSSATLAYFGFRPLR